jgi:hypothetical protein
MHSLAAIVFLLVALAWGSFCERNELGAGASFLGGAVLGFGLVMTWILMVGRS